MNKSFTKISSLILILAFTLTTFAGCTKDPKPAVTATTAANSPAANSPAATQAATESQAPAEAGKYYDMYDKVQDSSELPDWTGKQLKLKVWYAHGTGDAKRTTSESDVVSPEFKRVTGIELDKDASFDNGGNENTVKMGMLNASNDWPDIAFSSGLGPFKDLLAAGKVYDLTELIKQYAPNMAKRMPADLFPLIKEQITNNNQTGETFGFPTMLGDPDKSLKKMDPSYISPNAQNGPSGFIYVRDDIIKKLYPTAKTQNEIDDLYVKNGKFTKEDLFDIPLKTKDDVFKMLYDIQALIKKEGIKENGKPLQVSYAYGGGDNWSAFTSLLPTLERIPANNNYFTYYDKTSKSLKLMFQQDFFKQAVKGFNKLVQDKIMDPNSLLENNATHLENLNNGQYAVVYLNDTPDETKLKAAGKTFRYRKVWLDSPVQTDKFISPSGPTGINYSILIFKDKVKEEDLPQIIRYLDYMMSEVGEKMYTWGPKSAGLFNEVDGKRTFKDKDLEDAMVYNKDNGSSVKYNLNNTRLASTNGFGNTWPYYPTYMWGNGKVAPLYTYEKVRSPGDALAFFDPGNLPGNTQADMATTLKVDSAIWAFFSTVPSANEFWKGRDALEKVLTKTMTAKNDAQFEALWKTFSDQAIASGATPATLKDINDYFAKENAGILN
ncbi:hypothetical protein EHS13_29790 [Paenibacillus psychroresistens]|uniref:Extracellular solute-binding protein n=1 Tax=Paenibacillus psychroresistens TaxID=1778678 RepID=A0A6B8RQW2_9BACL|nr:hypothetical protein [Paenibacillus psychroresistens]QGQ98770.1 hypothetical protein EHS13_29790 [Paenibacillus psychroresistens]